MGYGFAYAALALLWICASVAGGAVLALLAQRMHPALSFGRLWAFYALLLALAAAAYVAIGIL